MLSPADQPPALIDTDAIAAELAKLADDYAGRERELRTAVAQRLKSALAEGRRAAEQLLMADRHGRTCAERLCLMQDEIIRMLHDLTARLYRSTTPSDSERMAVVATGGYGRGLMAPGSDIDLLFLLPYKQTAWGESVAEGILYCLWDMGLKVGHATRSVDECIRQAKADMTIRTALLEARYLLGDRALYDEFVTRFDKDVVRNTGQEFVTAKLAEREERLRRAGQSRYLVEPNVKDGKGGLRDLHTLFWIAKYVYRVHSAEELIERGVFNQSEYKMFRDAEDFLWAVRCHMHFVMGRAEERLSFDIQREIAVRLGYTAHPGMRDVERFMKHYFLVAKDVGDLTAILSSALEEREAKPAPVLDRLMARFKPRPRRVVLDSEDFVADHNRINIADPDVFRRDPVNLIRIFRLAQKHNLAFHPAAMHAASRSLRLIDQKLRDDKTANALFLEILTSDGAEVVLRRMNEAGVLGRFVRAFGKIVAMMQFNMYHHYTVDEHLLRCIGILAEIEAGGSEEFALANELMKTIQPAHRDLLYVALFLHDIAKGRVEDHSIAGARVARRFCPRLGLSAVETETVSWLVEQHLVMSTIAQSRDLSDRKTIENFAGIVQSLERMKLLLILTASGHPRGRTRRMEFLEGAAVAHALLRDRAGADRRLLRGRPPAPRQDGASRIPPRDEGLGKGRDRRLYRAPLSGLLAQGRSDAQSFARAFPQIRARGEQGGRDRRRLRHCAWRDRTHRAGARPPAAPLGDRGRVRGSGREHRGRADLHHHRRAGARHHRGVARVRP